MYNVKLTTYLYSYPISPRHYNPNPCTNHRILLCQIELQPHFSLPRWKRTGISQFLALCRNKRRARTTRIRAFKGTYKSLVCAAVSRLPSVTSLRTKVGGKSAQRRLGGRVAFPNNFYAVGIKEGERERRTRELRLWIFHKVLWGWGGGVRRERKV